MMMKSIRGEEANSWGHGDKTSQVFVWLRLNLSPWTIFTWGQHGDNRDRVQRDLHHYFSSLQAAGAREGRDYRPWRPFLWEGGTVMEKEKRKPGALPLGWHLGGKNAKDREEYLKQTAEYRKRFLRRWNPILDGIEKQEV